MEKSAGFLKRLLAFIIDTTVIFLITWLLFLFPFSVIIGNSIVDDYKNSYGNPYSEISTKYSGKVSYFNTTTSGYYDELETIKKASSITVSELNKETSNILPAYNKSYEIVSSIIASQNSIYDEALRDDEQFINKLYLLSVFVDNMYEVQIYFPMNDEYNHYEDLKAQGIINNETEYQRLVSEYKTRINDEHQENLKIILKALFKYGKENNFNIKSTTAYKKIVSKYKGNLNEIEGLVESGEIDILKDRMTAYLNYENAVTTKEYLGLKTGETDKYNISNEAYYIFYYNLYFNQQSEQLRYYSKVYEYNTWSIVYYLSMFTLAFSIYTVSFRGNTLGRRAVKIKLIDGKEKLNPLVALLHDVVLRFLYIILLGLLSMLVSLLAMMIITIADIIMILKGKEHKTVRDLLSGTSVIELA